MQPWWLLDRDLLPRPDERRLLERRSRRHQRDGDERRRSTSWTGGSARPVAGVPSRHPGAPLAVARRLDGEPHVLGVRDAAMHGRRTGLGQPVDGDEACVHRRGRRQVSSRNRRHDGRRGCKLDVVVVFCSARTRLVVLSILIWCIMWRLRTRQVHRSFIRLHLLRKPASTLRILRLHSHRLVVSSLRKQITGLMCFYSLNKFCICALRVRVVHDYVLFSRR